MGPPARAARDLRHSHGLADHNSMGARPRACPLKGPSVRTLQQTQSLTALVDELLTEAGSATSHRAARTIYGGQAHDLRQTVIALTRDASLGEHESPGEATLQVLAGR